MSQTAILKASLHSADGRTLELELCPARNGGVVIEYRSGKDWDHRMTHLHIPAEGKARIMHEEQGMMVKRRYIFEVPQLNEIRMLAHAAIQHGKCEAPAAQTLAESIEATLAQCKKGETGKLIEKQGGWLEAIHRNAEARRHASGRW